MSKKDVKKGIAIQAKVDAEKVEKLAQGLNAHKSVLANLESGQTQIRDAIGIVLDDMSAGEAKLLYDLEVKKTPEDLDITEKRVLCACLYTLLSSYGQDSLAQSLFYTNLEKYLGVTERKADFDFNRLSNIDSHTDRLVVLKAICSFLFLNQESFSFLQDKDALSWLFAFAPIKDISDICNAINAEYAVLGSNGIIGNYDPALAPSKEMEDRFYALTSGENEPIDDDVFAEEDEYQTLSDIVINALADESSFGKGASFSEKDLMKELPKGFSDVAFDSLIAVSKIEKGYLILTTYGIYVKYGNGLRGNYVCLPYLSIDSENIATTEGRREGTRKILIPVIDSQGKRTISIDDSVLVEEKLRDLIIEIKQSKCDVAPTDRIVQVDDVDEAARKALISAICYIFRKENLPLIDVYDLAEKWGFAGEWNTLATSIEDEESFTKAVREYIQTIPYPSKRVTSLKTMELIMGFITHANSIEGREKTFLSLSLEKHIYSFAESDIDKQQFNVMVKHSVNSIKNKSYQEYIKRKEELTRNDVVFKELMIPYLDLIISTKEAGIDHKAKEAAQKTARRVSKFAHTITEKLKDNLPVKTNKKAKSDEKE